MPPRGSSTESGLTDQQLAVLAEALATGKRATVYLREPTPSLNLPAGASARVVRIEGRTLTLRPRGIDDELPFESDELRATRAEPKAKPAATTPPRAPAPKPAAVEPAALKAPAPKPEVSAPVEPLTPPAEPARPKPPARTPKKVQDGISVTIAAGVDDEWTVAVAYGGKQRGKAATVSADAVGRAVAELGDPAAQQAVDAVLVAARQSAAKRVAELSRQLDEARTALAALGEGQP